MALISEIFKSIGIPTKTYVSRDNGLYEKKLRSGLLSKGTLCLLTGPSKTGKTTLYTHVVSQLSKVDLVIRCSNQVDSDEFWKIALEKVKFDRVEGLSSSTTLKGGTNFKFGWAALLSELNISISGEATEEKIREKILAKPSPDHLIPVLKNTNYQLIVEDFHYLDVDVQVSIFQQWKSFVDNEISVLVVSTTHHAADIAISNGDLVGRISHIELERWSKRDLAKIVRQGIEYLNFSLDDEIISLIAGESVGLPIVTQQICHQIFFDRNIENVKIPRNTKDLGVSTQELFDALHFIATSKYSNYDEQFNILASGLRKTKYKTYEKILLAFTVNPIRFELSFKELNDRIKLITDNNSDELVPPPQAIKKTLVNLNKIQVNRNFEVVEWISRIQKLFILHPVFLFFIRWKERKDYLPKVNDILSELDRVMAKLDVSFGQIDDDENK